MGLEQWLQQARLAAALVVLGAVGACNGDGSTSPVPVVAVVVTPATMTLYPGMSVRVAATVRDENGTALTRPVSWASDRASVATVDATGSVTAIAAGAAGITATSGGVSGGAMVTVLAPVQSVVLSIPADTLVTGATVQLRATLRSALGEELARPVTWTSGTPAVASVSAEGVLTGISPGTTTITAISEGMTDAKAITVLAPVAGVAVEPVTSVIHTGETVQLGVRVTDSGGQSLDRAVTWSSLNPAVARVDANGLVRGMQAGLATITATSVGVTGVASLVVLAPVHTINVTLFRDTLLVAQTMQLQVTLRDAAGAELLRPVTWTSDAPGVVAIGSTGFAVATSAGVATITAAIEGRSASVKITVVAATFAVSIEPADAVAYTNRTLQLAARVVDADGNLLARALAWASSQPGVATVSATGLVRGMSAGHTTITVTSSGVVGAANITVFVPAASVVLAPSKATIVTSATLQLAATPKTASGLVINRDLTWTSDAPNVATVSSSGLVTGVSLGTAHVTAAIDGVSATSNFTVLARAATLAVTPVSASLNRGGTVQMSAISLDIQGAAIARPASWRSVAPGIATVDASGLVTGVAGGTTAIIASLDDVADTAAVFVTEPVAQLRLILPSDSIEVAEAILIVAQSLDTKGVVLNRPVTWQSSDPSVATVNTSGSVTGMKTGSATITAISGGVSKSVGIRVLVPVDRVVVSAPLPAVVAGQTLLVSASMFDSQNRPLTRAVRWETSDPLIATVSSAGVVTGVTPGTVSISALAGTKRSSLILTVSARVGRVSVTASSTTVSPSAPTALVTAATYDTQNNPVQRPVTWTSSDATILSVTSTGPQSATVTAVGSGIGTITATSEGVSGSVNITSHGPPTATEDANNLSWPTVFADGFTILGATLGIDAGLRPLVSEGITVDSLPFWYGQNDPDWLNSYYLQGGDNTWRAEWLDGTTMSQIGADVYWGDNLTHHEYNTHSVIHIEVALFGRNLATMRGFNMFALSGSGSTEVQGTDGTVGSFVPILFTVHPRLIIEKIDAQGGIPLFTIVDKKVVDGFGMDGPNYYRAELNKAGKVVYGYNLMLKDLTVPVGQTKYGWYRLNFILEDAVTVRGTSIPRRVLLGGLMTGDDDTETPLFVPVRDPNGKRSYLDVFISSASGGH